LLDILRRLVPVIFSLAIPSVCLFTSAGRFDWWNAWLLLGLNFAASVATMALLWRDKELLLLAERSNVKAGKSWDKVLVGITVLLGPAATWITAGLDYRFHRSGAMPDWMVLLGVVVAALAAALIAWAMRTNRFFSAVVRIQRDRGHMVINAGPYGYLRHPGYAGMAAFTLVTPLILNSRWALVPAIATAAMTVLRTALEDRTLLNELEGYADYAQTVKCKLVPAIW
jgi:protein-S-isoprenylcysteine O-methyltransferase Ste14